MSLLRDTVMEGRTMEASMNDTRPQLTCQWKYLERKGWQFKIYRDFPNMPTARIVSGLSKGKEHGFILVRAPLRLEVEERMLEIFKKIDAGIFA